MIMCFNPWVSSSQEISASAAESHRSHYPGLPAGGWYCIFDPIACFPVCECRAGIWHFPLLASQTPNWSCLLKQKPVGMPHRPVCSLLGTLRYLLLLRVLLVLTPWAVCVCEKGFKFHQYWDVSCQNFSCAHSQFAPEIHNPSHLCF